MNFLLATRNIVTLLSILWVFFVYGSQSITVIAHESKNQNVVIIHVDENGFEPNVVIVKPHNEVVFENVGREGHWPASNNHPTHTLYGGTSLDEHCGNEPSATFDSYGPIPAGESWSFVFEKIGTFGYHDHLWPHFAGEIIVKEKDDNSVGRKNIFLRFLDFIYQIFVKISSHFSGHKENLTLNIGIIENSSYEDLMIFYEDIVLESDPKDAIRALREESLQDSKVSALCHDVLHRIGQTAYRKYGSFKEATKFQSDYCNSGYIHGVFESYFSSTDNPLAGLVGECDEYASFGGRLFDLWQCRHGVGHGLMYLTGGDLDKSLELCEEGLGNKGGPSCQNGVYMEVFNLEVLAKENRYVDRKNPFLTCSTRDVSKTDCYFYIPTYLSQTKRIEFSDIFEECDNAELGYKDSCIQGVGAEAMKRNMNRGYQDLSRISI